MRSRAVAILLAVFLVADMALSGVCCPFMPTAAPAASGCCGEEPTSPCSSILEDFGSAGRTGCSQGCYETPGSAVARQGTDSPAGRFGAIAAGWIADTASRENPSPCLRCSLPPSLTDVGHLAPTPRGPPVN